MKLAEQIKDVLRKSDNIDFTDLSNALVRIFTKNPLDYVEIIPTKRYYEDAVSNRGMWTIEIPKEWIVDVLVWAKGKGFRVKEEYGNNGRFLRFYIHLI